MVLQVGKKYVTKDGFIYTIISTNRKNKDGHNVVAECERVDDRGNKCPVFETFTSDGKNTNSEFNLIKEYKPRLRVEFGEKKVNDTKYVLRRKDVNYQVMSFFRKNNAASSIDDATIMSLNEAKTTLESFSKESNWEIWSIKMAPQLVEKYDEDLIKTKIKALEEELEKLKKQL